MSSRTALRLGRVSNLPTVWTNVLAGALLSGAGASALELAGLALCVSLLYVGGMYLNDAFDREIDARERPERPIPSGEVRASTVFGVGFALLGLGATGLAALGAARGYAGPACAAALGLSGLIVLYDVHHKQSRVAPLVMGLCRAGVYVSVATALGGAPGSAVLLGSAALWAYVVGLTALAAQENLRRIRSGWPLLLLLAPVAVALGAGPPSLATLVLLAGYLAWIGLALHHLRARRIPLGVVTLIAGISWLDALLIAAARPEPPPLGAPALLLTAALAVALTRALQTRVPGT